jgi:pimeloyl-ACP methyl ester carboxylesterase
MTENMQFIRSTQKIQPVHPNGKTIVYMLGYGGYAWQSKRHLKVLCDQGYALLVLDFRDVLKRRNPQDLVTLMAEVSALLRRAGLLNKNTVLLGVSLGGLVGYNMIRKHPELNKLLVITGGDMTHIPSPRLLRRYWHLSRDELAQKWQGVNIYTPVGAMQHKHVIMLLPERDRVIDPQEVADEIARHAHLNDFTIIPTRGGHFRTIITETIVAPRRRLGLIDRLAQF